MPLVIIPTSQLPDDILEKRSEQNKSRYPSIDDVKMIQMGLGVPSDQCDGKWGVMTVAYLVSWQTKNGFEADGLLTTEQFQHFPTNFDTIPEPVQKLPLFTKTAASGKQGYYDHAYDPSDPTKGSWPVIDSQWEQMTSTGSWLASMLRLLTGRSVNRAGVVTYDREVDDFVTLDTYSVGIAHWWAGTAPDQLFQPLVQKFPALAEESWGKEGAKLLRDSPDKVMEITGIERGHRRYNPRTLSWIVAGWYHIARRPEVIAFMVELWCKDYVSKGLSRCRTFKMDLSGSNGGLILAAVTRICNSGPALADRSLSKFYKGVKNQEDAIKALKTIYHTDRDENGYSKGGNGPGRWKVLETSCKVPLTKSIIDGDYENMSKDSLDYTIPISPSRGA